MTIDVLPQQFRQTMKGIVKTAQEIISESNRQLVPITFLCKNNEIQPIAMDFSDEEHKDFSSAAVSVLARKFKPEFIIFISEAWGLNVASENQVQQAAGKSLEHHPNRREIVIYTLETAHGTWFGSSEIIRHGDGKRSIGDPEFIVADKAVGRFANFLAQGEVQ